MSKYKLFIQQTGFRISVDDHGDSDADRNILNRHQFARRPDLSMKSRLRMNIYSKSNAREAFIFNDSSIIPELVLTKKPFPNSYIYLVFSFLPG